MDNLAPVWTIAEPVFEDEITAYDRACFTLFLGLLDWDAAGATWQDAAREFLKLDPLQPGAQRMHRLHLQRAKWMTRVGYRLLVEEWQKQQRATKH